MRELKLDRPPLSADEAVIVILNIESFLECLKYFLSAIVIMSAVSTMLTWQLVRLGCLLTVAKWRLCLITIGCSFL